MGRMPILLLTAKPTAMELILKALAQTFPQADLSRIGRQSRFEEVKGWDSMTSVNFQIELESLVGGAQLDFVVTGDQTLQSLDEEMQAKGLLPKN